MASITGLVPVRPAVVLGTATVLMDRPGVEARGDGREEAPHSGLPDVEGPAGGSGRSRGHGETTRSGNGEEGGKGGRVCVYRSSLHSAARS